MRAVRSTLYNVYRRIIGTLDWVVIKIAKSGTATNFAAYRYPSLAGKTIRTDDGHVLRFEKFPEARKLLAQMMLEDEIVVRTRRNGDDAIAWIVDSDHNTISTPSGIVFRLTSLDPPTFAETFVDDIHFVGFDLTGFTIIDAGGFVGDTALYFASKRANVITFEPDPKNYELLLENLSLNEGLRSRITPVNAALGMSGRVDFVAGRGGASSQNGVGKPISVQSFTLSEVIEQFRPTGKLVLHLDIKGNEAYILRDPGISKFDRVTLEYSMTEWPRNVSGSVQGIVDQLHGIGFSQVRIFRNTPRSRQPLTIYGMIDASKGPQSVG